MTRILQLKGGSTAQNAAYTGVARELTVDVTKNTIRVHDGATLGGTELARMSDIITSHTLLTDRELADQHPIAAITGLQTTLDNKSDITHTHTLDWLSDVTITAPTSGDGLLYNGTQWINFGGAAGSGAAKRIWSNNVPSSAGTTQIIPSITPPLVTDGTQIWTITITPLSVNSSYVVQTSISAAASNNNANLTMALFRGNTYLGATVQIANSGNNSATLTINITDRPNTTAPITYQVRIGTSTATWYVNRRSNENTYGGLNNGYTIWEY